MAKTQDLVLLAVKNGCKTRKDILESTELTFAQIHNSLKRLRKWDLIKSDMHGNYSFVEV